MKFIKLTQSDMEKGRLVSEVHVNFDTVKSFYRDQNKTETILRFVDDTAIGVQEGIETIVKYIEE